MPDQINACLKDEMRRDPRAVYRVVGVLADTPSRVGREIYRVPVLGTIDELAAVVERLDRRGKRPQKLIITAQNLPGDRVRRLLERADALAIPLARLPRQPPPAMTHTQADATSGVKVEGPGQSPGLRLA